MADLNISTQLMSIEYIRLNKIDGIALVELDEDGNEIVDIDYDKDGNEDKIGIYPVYVLVNKIDEIDDEKPVKIYGTVVATDGMCGDQIVYDRSWKNTESKVPGESLSLTGPSVEVFADGPLYISACLWFHDDDEIVKGEIEGQFGWEMDRAEHRQPPFDQLVEGEIWGKYGSVSVGYSVITDALYATINIVMINFNGHKESPAAVYGTIKALRTFYNGFLITRILFDKLENESVQVSGQKSLPLTRPVFPIGVDSDLTIAVDLWDHEYDCLSPPDDHLPSLSPDDQIALGSVQFTPIIGTQSKNITGKYGELQVSFTCVHNDI